MGEKKTPALAKITFPVAEGLLARPRLFDWLDRESASGLVWLCGPPGCGKTSLTASYLAQHPPNVLWFQVDPGDNDPATFFHYLGLAIRHAKPRLKTPPPALTPEYLPGLAVFVRRYLEAVVPQLPGTTILVLDNYEQLPDESPLHDVIRETAECLPPEWRLWVLSRRPPPAPFARLRLHGRLAVLEGGDLSLTAEESRQLAAQRAGGTPLDLRWIDRLHEESQGWIAGLLLLLAQRRLADKPELLDLSGDSRQLLFDYFATELFERLNPGMQAALSQAALLPSVTVRQAEILSGDRAVGDVLRALWRQNYFVVQREGSEPVYEFHPLFRAFLLHRAQTGLAPGAWQTLQNRAAELLAGSGRPDLAADLFKDARNWDRLAALLLAEAPGLIATGRHRALAQWMEALPESQCEKLPWLHFWLGTARLPFNPAAARGLFEQAYAQFKFDGDVEGLYSAWAGIMDTFFYEWRDLHPADPWIAELEVLRETHPDFPSRVVELRTYWAMGTLLHREPNHRLLRAWSKRGMKLLESDDHRDLTILVGGYLLIGFLWRGETGQARLVIERVDPRARADEAAPLVQILWSCAVAFYHSVLGEQTPCLERVHSGMALADRTGLHCWDFLLAAQAARCNLVAGEPAVATDWMETMAQCMRPESLINGGFLRHLRANASAQTGDWDRSVNHAEAGLALAIESGVPFLEAHCRIDLARGLLGQGHVTEATAQASLALQIGTHMSSDVVVYLALETLALTAFRQADVAAARGFLDQALALSRRMDGAIWLMSGPRCSAEVYNQALAANLHVDHVERMIRRCHIEPPTNTEVAANWPWPLRIHTLGRFELILDGKPLRFSGKAQAKPLELLKALAALGGLAVPEEQLAELLWPDAEGDTAHQSFATTLHRLRRLLGDERALVLEERCLSLSPRRVWLDTWAFERPLASAGNRPQSGEEETRLEQTLALYQGPFLREVGAAWVLLPRERLRARFLWLTECLGAGLEQRGEHSAAIERYSDALRLEPYAERLFLGLMRCYQALGRPGDAITAYHHCQKNLATMSLSPSAAMTNLYTRLMN